MSETNFGANISGLDELEEALEELVPKAAKTALRRAARSGAEIYAADIEERAPRDTGLLADSVIVRTTVGKDDDDSTITASVSIDMKANRLAEGAHNDITGPTLAVGRNGKLKEVLLGKSGRALKNPYHWAHLEAVFAEFGTVHEPATPFVGPAFEEKKDDVLNVFVEELQEEIEKVKK
jgi:HK97 gp10 family phage protein